MTNVIGHIRAAAVKRADILRYMEGIAPGTNRRSHHKTLKKLWRWAHDLGHVGNDPMAKLKPLDEWGVTYAQSFRSSGDVARAMGDAESTLKRFYVRTLEPGAGKEWFDLSTKRNHDNSLDASATERRVQASETFAKMK